MIIPTSKLFAPIARIGVCVIGLAFVVAVAAAFAISYTTAHFIQFCSLMN